MGNNISFIQPRDAWDRLSIPEKAEMMKVAVNHGIYNLNDIRQKYNEFALGGDTEEASVSPNEAARMGAMVGAAIAARPKGYIGGSTSEARQKYWKTDNEMRMLTDSVANQYSISPDLLRTRMDNEGYTDARINEINKDVKEGTNRALMGTALFNSEALPYVAGSEFGLDDVATYINNGTVNLINENWGDGQFQNEKGRWTRMAMGHNYSDNIGIMAATLKALKDIARKDFPNASDADLDRYASAYYNRGIKGGRDWAKRGAKGYKVNKHSLGGNLFDGTTQPSQQMQIGLNVQGWPNYTTEQLVAYGEENKRRRKAIQDAYLNFVTESNDATAVANGRPQNQHLVDKAVRGAKAHAAWEKEHPTATQWGNVLGAVPFAVASIPFVGTAVEIAPAIMSTLAPGSAFWTNPVTQQITKSTLGGVSADAISTLITGNTIGGNVKETIGWQPNNEWAKLGYGLLTDMANPGYMFGAKRPGFDIVPSPITPSRGSAQMPHGRNFGTFRPESFNNWGSESLTHLTKDYAVKVPKQSKTPVDVGPKTFDDLGWRYRAAVNQKLAANKIAGFEPYEYVGYHTTEGGYVPVFRQKRLTLMGENTPEGKIFNEEALSDIEREMRTHSGLWKSWNIGDYGPAHNIGKNAEGVGRLFDANYAREPITWIMQNFPRKWEISPIGNARLFGNTLEKNANE